MRFSSNACVWTCSSGGGNLLQNGLPWECLVENQCGGRIDRDRKPNLVQRGVERGREERATDRMPNFEDNLDFAWRWKMIAWWLRSPTPTSEVLLRISGETKFILSNRNEIGM